MRKLVLLLATERVDSKPGQLGVPPQEAVVVALGSLSHEQDVGRAATRAPRETARRRRPDRGWSRRR